MSKNEISKAEPLPEAVAGTTGRGVPQGAMTCPLARIQSADGCLNEIVEGCPAGRKNSPSGLDEVIMGVLGGSRNAPPNGDATARLCVARK